MSGGSWNYAYEKVEEMAVGLSVSADPLRRAFASHLKGVARAMKAVEWVDSCDSGPGDEVKPIRLALGKDADPAILRECVADLDRAVATAQKARGNILASTAGMP
jgi:hypothetical protein